jgi:predicted unusual protein kinase regulating ubiquinone biosynthesis (AarF/ABC1/UbiB family)
MTLALGHLPRYAQIARLLVRYGRDLARVPPEIEAMLEGEREADEAAAPTPAAEAFARDLETLGPTFVKLGQLLSSRADLLPLPYLAALARLQDSVEPFDYAAVERTIEDELGVRISKGFATFERDPLAAASLGQVHRATLRDGRPVAVKVQRPGIQETVAADLAALRELAVWLDAHSELGRTYGLTGLVDEFGRTLARELDYRTEAQHLIELGRLMEPYERILVPAPVGDYTGARVLTMELVRGRKVTEIAPIVRLELDGAALADELFRAYLHQILVAGFFHADPHPGNVFLTEDHRLALLDLGMVGRVSSERQEKILRMLLAAAEERGDEVAAIAGELGEKTAAYDARRWNEVASRLAAELQYNKLADIDVGRLLMGVVHESARAGVRMPSELALLGKTLLQLDQIGRSLDPGFDPNAAIRRHAAEITAQRVRRLFSPGSLLSGLNDFKELARRMPDRVGRILDRLAANDLEIRVQAIDQQLLMSGFQKVANRIATGLVLAALIVGSAMLLQVPTSFRILGYPGFAILFFLAAAAGGVALLLNILLSDLPQRKR